MFEFIKGEIVDICGEEVIVENGGIGYSIRVSANTLSNISSGGDTQLYIHEHIREDEISLYGFGDRGEREIFRSLLGVSGIGPRVSLAILSKFRAEELLKYISLEDEKALSSVSGIGKKTANRIILELKDKFKNISLASKTEEDLDVGEPGGLRQDGISALMSLGYDYHQSAKLVDTCIEPGITLEELIKKALVLKKND